MIDVSPSLAAQALGCFAFAGDLSMGQPVDHSPRTGLLAHRLSLAIQGADADATDALVLSLLRWAGCTANAQGFAELFGDDVAGRAALIENRNPFLTRNAPNGPLDGFVRPLAAEHCEVAREIGLTLGLPGAAPQAALDLFEHWDGSGLPAGKKGEAISITAQIVALCGDLEVFARVYGATKAVALVESRAGWRYEPALVRLFLKLVPGWLDDIGAVEPWKVASNILADLTCPGTLTPDSLSLLLADYVDLKIPALGQPSRRAAGIAADVAHAMLPGRESVGVVRRATLLYGLGWTAVPHPVMLRGVAGTEADHEQIRLVPYWTERILKRAPIFGVEATIASRAFERLDGSGFHRGLAGAELTGEVQAVNAGTVAAALLQPQSGARPTPADMQRMMEVEIEAGRLGEPFARAALHAASGDRRRLDALALQKAPALTERERDVLRLLAIGQTNKAIARDLGMSPKTAGTHVESIYRKLGVTTRAAAALRSLHVSQLN